MMLVLRHPSCPRFMRIVAASLQREVTTIREAAQHPGTTRSRRLNERSGGSWGQSRGVCAAGSPHVTSSPHAAWTLDIEEFKLPGVGDLT